MAYAKTKGGSSQDGARVRRIERVSHTVRSAGRHGQGRFSGFAIAASSGDVHGAGRFLGAAEDIRARLGIAGPTVFSYHQRV